MSHPRRHYQRRESAAAWVLLQHITSADLPAKVLRPKPRSRPGHKPQAGWFRRIRALSHDPQVDWWIDYVCSTIKAQPKRSLNALRLNHLYKALLKYLSRGAAHDL